MRGYQWVRRILVPLGHMMFRFRFVDLQNIPPRGAAILVANHASVVDHFILAAATRRSIVNLGHREAFGLPIAGRLLQWAEAIPIWRSGGDVEALDAAAQALEAGRLLCVFPEGDWTPDGRVHRFHTGAARLAVRTGVPLIPVAITGSHERRWGKGFRPGGEIGLQVGAPVMVGPDGDVREVSDALQTRVAAMAGVAAAPDYAQAVPAADNDRRRD